jgi:membrane-associated phospholipid phosphatase
MPTAPPWMFPSFGFIDGVNHTHSLLAMFGNKYAAMPSLHAADALIVGVSLFAACRRWYFKAIWAIWPAWVWFCVLATANHFWLDVVAGITVALVALTIVRRVPFLSGRRARPIANLL